MSAALNYATGASCTWHGWLDQAALTNGGGVQRDGQTMWRVCPRCGGALNEVNDEAWWALVELNDDRTPEASYERMMRWGQGRCFPDEETLVNAYRQAMEE